MDIDSGKIRRDELRQLLRMWEASRDDAGPPPRARFAPVDVAIYLSNMLFVEVIGSPPRFRYREVGVDLIRIYGEDITDRYLDEMPRLFQRFVEPAYHEVLATRGATHDVFRFVENWWIATYERLMLPLTGNCGQITEVAVAIYPRIRARRARG